jgi:hypothetical protein
MRAWNWQDVAVHEAAHTAATAKKKKNLDTQLFYETDGAGNKYCTVCLHTYYYSSRSHVLLQDIGVFSFLNNLCSMEWLFRI